MAKRRPGTYDAILPDLKPRPIEDPGWQAKVDNEKARITTEDSGPNNAPLLVQHYALARAEKELKAAELAIINVRVAALEQLLTESQDHGDEGWGQYGVADNALRLPDGSTVRIQKEPYGKVVDKEAFRLWCIENGYGDQLMLWPSTTNLVVKERLLAGEPEPAGIEAFFLTKVVFSEGK